MVRFISSFFKENPFCVGFFLLSISILFNLNRIQAYFNLHELAGVLWVASILVFAISLMNIVYSLCQLVAEEMLRYSSVKKNNLYSSNDIVLHVSRFKYSFMSVISILFLAESINILLHSSRTFKVWGGWLGVILCGFFLGTCIIQLIPRASFLRISQRGILVSSFWRVASFEWADIDEFGVKIWSECSSRGFLWVKRKAIYLKISKDQTYKVKNVLPAYSFFIENEYLLPDNYGMLHEDLAKLLNEKKKQYIVND